MFVSIAQCGVQNFRRRDHCFKCSSPKVDIDEEGADEVSLQPTASKFRVDDTKKFFCNN